MKFPEESLQDHTVGVARRVARRAPEALARERAYAAAGRDQRERRRLPWVRSTAVLFDATEGRQSLADLFAGRSQLLIHRISDGSGVQAGHCGARSRPITCDGVLVHLTQRDVSFVRVSRAPLAEIQAFNARMGWRIRWVSSLTATSTYDFNVSFGRRTSIADACYNYRWRGAGRRSPGPDVYTEMARRGLPRLLRVRARGGGDDDYFYLDLYRRAGRERWSRKSPVTGCITHDRYDLSHQHDRAGRFNRQAVNQSANVIENAQVMAAISTRRASHSPSCQKLNRRDGDDHADPAEGGPYSFTSSRRRPEPRVVDGRSGQAGRGSQRGTSWQ